MTYFWLTRWPNRTQSLIAGVTGAICVASWSLIQAKPGLAALACTALAITGGYIAFFHNTKWLLANMTLALGVAVAAAYRLAKTTDVPTAAGAFWVIWLLNLAVPLAIRGMSGAIADYSQRSGQDALTGLLNKRFFVDAVTNQLTAERTAPGMNSLSIFMVDLDDFKRVNDTYGHPAGDRVLLHVAQLLRTHLPETAAICRAGGEEFLIALPSASADSTALAARLCTAIETTCSPAVTASIGVATAPVLHPGQPSSADVFDRLVVAADAAMYAAKRNGGNRVQHADASEHWSPQPRQR
jgi:diguanylate cyclase (GGDEF)-like protein